MINISTSNLKANNAKFKEALGGGSPIITPTDLRLEQVLVNGREYYEFKVLEAVGNGDRPLENKLKTGHRFAITHIALNLHVQLLNNEANKPLMTFPDQNQIASAAEAASLEAIYQGTLQIKTGNVDRTAKILTHHLRYVPSQGYQTAAATGQTPAGPEMAEYGGSLEKRGYFELAEPLILSADDDNKIILTIGKGLLTSLASATANTSNVAVLMLHGLYYSGESGFAGLSC